MTTGERLIGGAARLVVTDDASAITVATYAGAERVATVAIDPLRALSIAGQLIAAAHQHLARASNPSSPQRGGDHRADKRTERDEALCELAWLAGADLSVDRLADAVISKANRYRPAPSDPNGSAERRALHRLSATGLSVPGKRHLRRILGQAKSRLDGQQIDPPSTPAETEGACSGSLKI